MLQWPDPKSFVAYVKFFHKNILLVEGTSDHAIFRRLRSDQDGVKIDTAEQISSTRGRLGNRQKIERVADIISDKEYAGKFVGFVDREFREFKLGDSIADNMTTQLRRSRVIWSRGHSIENYFFDFSFLRNILDDLVGRDDEVTHQALLLMEDCFHEIICIASALSLYAYGKDMLTKTPGVIEWQDFKYSGDSISLDAEKYAKKMLRRQLASHEESEEFPSEFQKHLAMARNSQSESVRWICHGHIGFKVIRQAYAKFFDVVNRNTELNCKASDALNFRDDVLLKTCARHWAMKDDSTSSGFPRICFEAFDNNT